MVVRLQRTRPRRWTTALVVRGGNGGGGHGGSCEADAKDVEEEEETDVGKKGGLGMGSLNGQVWA